MDTIKASEFRAKCLKLLNDVSRTGEALTITKHGVPVAKLIAIPAKGTSLIGRHAGQIEIRADIASPVSEVWEAEA